MSLANSGCPLLLRIGRLVSAIMHQVASQESLVATMILISALFNYSFCVVAVCLARNLRDFLAGPVSLAIFAWANANLFILLPSIFHAKSRRLHARVWSLLALTCDTCDTRLEHLRALWLKQLGDSGHLSRGIAFKWLTGTRITYVNIMQMMAGTATILVVAVRT